MALKPVLRPPDVPVWRRSAALALDGLAAWLISALLGMNNASLGTFLFVVAWLALRVILPQQRAGQSLGRWAFDMRLISTQWQRTPDLQTLLKREAIIGTETWFALVGLSKGLLPSQSYFILLLLPLAIDAAFIAGDPQRLQMLHDRVTSTCIVYRRGYSLDLKIQRLVDEVTRRMKQ